VTDRLRALPWWVRTSLATVAGAAASLGFAPVGWWPVLIVCVAALTLLAITAPRWWHAALVGLGYGFGLYLIAIRWMTVVFTEAMIGLSALEAAFLAVLAVLIRIAGRSRHWPLLAAGCWLSVEYVFSSQPFGGFPWLRLGYTVIDSPLAGLLPLVGVPGAGFAVALVGQLLAYLVLDAHTLRRRLWGVAGVALVLLSGTIGLLVPAGAEQGSVSVGYVQGNAPGGGIYGLGAPRTLTRNHVAETERLAARIASGEVAKPDFVVWPENGTDMDPFLDAETNRLVQAALDRAGVPILVGAILEGPGKDERRTASLWWDPEAGVQGTYIKRGIVPFGEWVPFRSILLPLIPELQYVGAQSIPGTAPGVLPVTLADGTALKLGILVCYDLVYDDFAYDTVRAGGQVQIVQSSNAMYQGTGQIEQQFAITRVRARELRREMLVVTTSGVSGLINPDGSVAFTEPDHVSASGVVELPTREGVTPAAWGASWIELTITLLAVVGLGLSLRYGRMDVEVTQLGEANGLPGRS